MVNPDDILLMSEQEKLDLLRQVADAEEWQNCFEPIYVRLMDDDSAKVRQEAIAALWEIADPRHMQPLMQKAESDPDPEVRAKAASVLGIYIYEAVVNAALEEADYLAVRAFLLDLAQNPSEQMIVRRMAIEALSFDTDEAVMDLIEWAYRHSHVEMRMTAVFAMGRSRNPRWTDAILSELDSKERQIQLEAINAAAEAGIPKATPHLRVLAGSKDKEIATAAIWALAHTRGPGAIETIEMFSQGEDEEIRNVAAEALEEFYEASRDEEEDREGDYDEDTETYD